MSSPFQSLASPALMGIVNVTPDSFSDASQFVTPGAALAHAHHLQSGGAHILDLGAEASSFFRPGVRPVSADEQLARLLPVLTAWDIPGSQCLVSIDTRSAAVARRALATGKVHIINDISAGTHDPEILTVAAQAGAAVILMHTGSMFPATPPHDDPDISASVARDLHARSAAAIAAGIPREHIALDPGVGFGKTMADNWRLALGTSRLASLGFPVVLGASRKRFLETSPPHPLLPDWAALFAQTRAAFEHFPNLHPRDLATAALTRRANAAIHRVHHVTLAQIALTML